VYPTDCAPAKPVSVVVGWPVPETFGIDIRRCTGGGNRLDIMAKYVGRRIRRIRQDRGLTLKQIESVVGISAAHLSMIERGMASPTIKSLERIALALGVRASNLIDIPPARAPEPVRPGSRSSVVVHDGSTTLEPLTNRNMNSEMSVFIATFAGDGRITTVDGNSGEEFCLVLDGFLEITVNDRPYMLRPGDSMHFKAVRSHSIRNPTETAARALWAVRPRIGL
jgi:transcriptional regulator with XRE-family HTH domain